MNILYIFIGGGVGSVLRYLISSHSLFKFESSYISGIMLVNVTGSVLIGLLAGWGFKNHGVINPLIMVGLLGGFTTFSSFALEAVHISSSGKYIDALLYVAVSVIFSIAGVVLGLKLT